MPVVAAVAAEVDVGLLAAGLSLVRLSEDVPRAFSCVAVVLIKSSQSTDLSVKARAWRDCLHVMP